MTGRCVLLPPDPGRHPAKVTSSPVGAGRRAANCRLRQRRPRCCSAGRDEQLKARAVFWLRWARTTYNDLEKSMVSFATPHLRTTAGQRAPDDDDWVTGPAAEPAAEVTRSTSPSVGCRRAASCQAGRPGNTGEEVPAPRRPTSERPLRASPTASRRRQPAPRARSDVCRSTYTTRSNDSTASVHRPSSAST